MLSCLVWLSRGWARLVALGSEAAAAFVRLLTLPVSCSLAWRHVGVWCHHWGFWRQRKEAFSVAPELGSLAFLVVMGYIDQRSMSMSSSLKPQYKLGKFYVSLPFLCFGSMLNFEAPSTCHVPLDRAKPAAASVSTRQTPVQWTRVRPAVVIRNRSPSSAPATTPTPTTNHLDDFSLSRAP